MCSLLLSLCLLLGVLPAGTAVAVTAGEEEKGVEIYMPTPTAETAELWYTLDNPAGTTVVDNAGGLDERKSISLSGTFVPDGGRIDGALSFNGSSDYVQLNNDGIGETGFLHGRFDQETVSFWVKPASLSGRQMLYKQGGDLGGIAIRINDGVLESSVATGSPPAAGGRAPYRRRHRPLDPHRPGVRPGDGQPVHGRGAGISAADRPYLYPAGPAGGAALGRNMFPANAFGETATDDPQWFSGMMDDVRVYRTAVTPQIILQKLEAGTTALTEGEELADASLPETVTGYITEEKTVEIPVESWEPILGDDVFRALGMGFYQAKLDYPATIRDTGLRALHFVLPSEPKEWQEQLTLLIPYVLKVRDNSLPSNDVTLGDITAGETEHEVELALDSVTPATEDAAGRIELNMTVDGISCGFSLFIPPVNPVGNEVSLQTAD